MMSLTNSLTNSSCLEQSANRDSIRAILAQREESYKVTLRRGDPHDSSVCGKICYEAFKNISSRHGFIPDFLTVDAATDLVSVLLNHPKFYSVVAERDGKIIGSNFLDERNMVVGVGPITIDPEEQNKGTGRLLMLDVLSRARERKFPGIRLVQDAFHGRSLSLYTRLGFVVREPLSVMNGPPINQRIDGVFLRTAKVKDLKECNRVCMQVHGLDRSGELEDSINLGSAVVTERGGRITGYSTGPTFFGHSVGRTNKDLMAIIGSRIGYQTPGFLVPSRNHDLFKWCLDYGLRVVKQMTLMTMGIYIQPRGAYLPSVSY